MSPTAWLRLPYPADGRDQSVSRSLGFFMAVAGAVAIAAEAQRAVGQAAQFARWWTMIAVGCSVLITVLVLTGRKLPMGVLRGAWMLVAGGLLAAHLTVFIAYRGAHPDALLPWTWRLESIGLCLLLLAAPPLVGIGYALLSATAPMLSGLIALGRVPTEVGEYTLIHLGNLAYAVFFLALRARLIRLARAERHARQKQQQRERVAADSARRADLARMVHDDVLSTLVAGARSLGTPSRELQVAAGATLDALSRAVEEIGAGPAVGVAPTAASMRRSLEDLARSIDPEVQLRFVTRGEGTLPPEVVGAISGALAESLRNSVRHAPTARRSVRCLIGEDRIRIEVADDGPGLDLRSIPADRLGVRASVLARMHALPGGRGEIDTADGGTVVRLEWMPEAPAAPARPVPVDDFLLTGAQARIALLWVCGTLLAYDAISDAPAPGGLWWLLYPAAALLAWGVTARTPGPLSAGRVRLIACGILVALLGVLMSLGDDSAIIEAVPLINFLGYLIAMLLLRGHILVPTATFGLLTAAVVAWGVAAGQPTQGILGTLTVPVTTVLSGALLRFILRRVFLRELRAVTSAEQADLQVAAEHAAATAYVREIGDIASAVEPLLQELQRGTTIDAQLQRELMVVEGAVRDSIRARHLAHPALTGLIAQVRRSGAEVLLIDDEDYLILPAEALSGLAQVFAHPGLVRVTVRAAQGQIRVVAEHDEGVMRRECWTTAPEHSDGLAAGRLTR